MPNSLSIKLARPASFILTPDSDSDSDIDYRRDSLGREEGTLVSRKVGRLRPIRYRIYRKY